MSEYYTDEIVRQMEVSGAIVDYTEYLNRELPIHKWTHHKPILTEGEYRVRFKWAGPTPTTFPMLVMWVRYMPKTDLYNITFELHHSETSIYRNYSEDIYVETMIDPATMLYDLIKSERWGSYGASEIKEIKAGDKHYIATRLYPSKDAAEADIRELQRGNHEWRGGYVAGGYQIQLVTNVPEDNPPAKEWKSHVITGHTPTHQIEVEPPKGSPEWAEWATAHGILQPEDQMVPGYIDEKPPVYHDICGRPHYMCSCGSATHVLEAECVNCGAANPHRHEHDEVPQNDEGYYFTVWNDIDEIPASPDTIRTYEEAVKWREQFIKRYEAQGYYSASSSHWRNMVKDGRLDIQMIKENPSAFFPIKAHEQETFLSHDGLDADGRCIPGYAMPAHYRWGKFSDYENFEIREVNDMVQLDEHQMLSMEPEDEHKDWIFYAYENDIDEGTDGVSVKNAYAFPADPRIGTTCFNCGYKYEAHFFGAPGPDGQCPDSMGMYEPRSKYDDLARKNTELADTRPCGIQDHEAEGMAAGAEPLILERWDKAKQIAVELINEAMPPSWTAQDIKYFIYEQTRYLRPGYGIDTTLMKGSNQVIVRIGDVVVFDSDRNEKPMNKANLITTLATIFYQIMSSEEGKAVEDRAKLHYSDKQEKSKYLSQYMQDPYKKGAGWFEPRDGAFPITYVTKDDVFERHPLYKKEIAELTDDEMKQLASNMADDYVEQLFWIQIDVVFGEYLERKRRGE